MLLNKFKGFLSKYYLFIFSSLILIGTVVIKFFPQLYVTNSISTTPINTVIDVSDSLETTITVDLSGAVNKPGVYTLASSSRVGDLLTLGGGLSSDASALWISRNINLSKPLADTQKIYVPFEWESYGDCACVIDTISLNIPNLPVTTQPPINPTTSVDDDTVEEEGAVTSSKINVNTSTAEELDKLPGIGPTYAQKIISTRPYKDDVDFASKSGIPKSTLDKLKSLISF